MSVKFKAINRYLKKNTKEELRVEQYDNGYVAYIYFISWGDLYIHEEFNATGKSPKIAISKLNNNIRKKEKEQ